jgi:hypothetical protein
MSEEPFEDCYKCKRSNHPGKANCLSLSMHLQISLESPFMINFLPELFLLCDGCPRGCHTFCNVPALDEVPASDWFCPVCLHQRLVTAAQAVREVHMCARRYDFLNGAQFWFNVSAFLLY